MKISIAICCGVVATFLSFEFCSDAGSLFPVVYWALPFFHLIFHPLLSGPSPQACLCCLALNFIIIVAVVFTLLSLRKR
jgi:hypothetical protein